MKKFVKFIAILLLSISPLYSQDVIEYKIPDSTSNEVTWAAYLAKVYTEDGITEYKLPAGARVDILTDEIAWEVEWCSKWPESIGQALYYGSATNRKPGVWLLKRANDDENWNECLSVINYLRGKGVDIEFKTEIVK